jgi:hypothetical protein
MKFKYQSSVWKNWKSNKKIDSKFHFDNDKKIKKQTTQKDTEDARTTKQTQLRIKI